MFYEHTRSFTNYRQEKLLDFKRFNGFWLASLIFPLYFRLLIVHIQFKTE